MAEQLKITLVDTLKDEWRTLRRLEEVTYSADGGLLIEDYSVGSALSDMYGDSDLERDAKVAPENVPKVLLALIEERFRDAFDFKAWLTRRDIDYSGSIW